MKKKYLLCLLCAAVILLSVAGCGGGRVLYKPSLVEQDDEWIKMVSEYRKAAKDNPSDQEIRANLKRAEYDGAEHFYQSAMEQKNSGKLDEAIASLQKGLAIMAENQKIDAALAECLAIKESNNVYRDAMAMKKSGSIEEAQKLLEKSLELQPMNADALKAMDELLKEHTAAADPMFSSQKKITIKFTGSDVKTVFDFIASSYGINVVYDEGVKTLPVSVSADDVTLEQALEMVVSSSGVFYKKIGPMAILVAQDNKAKRDQYEDLIIRTFQMNAIKAADMSAILKNTLNLKRVTVNDSLNTISIRDTADTIKLAEKLIRLNDRKLAEVVFDVEIMEVNRTKTEQLGLTYGTQMTLTLPTYSTVNDAISTPFVNMLKQGTLTLPALTLNFFKQDVDAKMLANPRVRVMDGKKASVHIGDKVPLRSSVVTDATGQVRYSYDYKDIGVMLDVTPKINFDNSVTVNLKLEVSSLGSNIGTASDPAYSIGTRDAETTMLLRDGETAIVGGLIRDEERNNLLKVPGLGDIPLVGSIFMTSTDFNGSRTDVLLTLTPRVIRSWDGMDRELREIYSGTENNMTSVKKLYAGVQSTGAKKEGPKDMNTGRHDDKNSPPQNTMNNPGVPPDGNTLPRPAGEAPAAFIQDPGNTTAAIAVQQSMPEITATAAVQQQDLTGTATVAAAQQEPTGDTTSASSTEPVILSFSQDQYILQSGQDGVIKVMAEKMTGITNMHLKLAYNTEFVKFVKADGSSPDAVNNLAVNDAKAGEGLVEMDLSVNTDRSSGESIEIAEVRFSGIKQGVSYILFLDGTIKNKEGLTVNVQKKASRFVVK